ASIRLEYVTELAVQADDGLRFCLPAVLNPRYQPQGSEDASAQVTSVPASLVPYSLSFCVQVSSPRPISKVDSSCSLDPLQYLLRSRGLGYPGRTTYNVQTKGVCKKELRFIVRTKQRKPHFKTKQKRWEENPNQPAVDRRIRATSPCPPVQGLILQPKTGKRGWQLSGQNQVSTKEEKWSGGEAGALDKQTNFSPQAARSSVRWSSFPFIILPANQLKGEDIRQLGR
ncbi:uncharacterized protein LOC106526289, partial [Austrofundulus limnaeus]|uniref:Uncharacterized protein LOC106526289 n=1 Tax=Austrofundulus limnaeus TaxID=52670 RepID=A0A2I4C8I3_AUSLI